MPRITSRPSYVSALVGIASIFVVAAIVASSAFTPAAPATPSASGCQPEASGSGAGHHLIDPSRSEVRFTVTKLGFSDVTGVFRQSDGEIRYDPSHPEASSVRWRVKVGSVLTDERNRDQSLQQAEYFNAALHPYLSFVSRSVRRKDAASLEVSGDITMRGVTRPLTVTVRPRAGENGPVFETEFQLDRYDFGIVGGTVLGRLIGSTADVRLVAATIPAPR
jgi:polyisoprenoid-binding protein YceI